MEVQSNHSISHKLYDNVYAPVKNSVVAGVYQVANWSNDLYCAGGLTPLSKAVISTTRLMQKYDIKYFNTALPAFERLKGIFYATTFVQAVGDNFINRKGEFQLPRYISNSNLDTEGSVDWAKCFLTAGEFFELSTWLKKHSIYPFPWGEGVKETLVVTACTIEFFRSKVDGLVTENERKLCKDNEKLIKEIKIEKILKHINNVGKVGLIFAHRRFGASRTLAGKIFSWADLATQIVSLARTIRKKELIRNKFNVATSPAA